jgi:hypothetical protein
MVEWIRANKPAKLEGLWKAVLPEGSTAPPAEFAADLFWLLHQGHILLFTDDTLVVQEVRDNPVQDSDAKPKTGKKKKKKSNKANPEGETVPAGESAPAEAQDNAPIPAAEVSAQEQTEETPAAELDQSEESESGIPAEPTPEEKTPAPTAPESEADEELSKNPSTGVDDAPGL